ncbi:MAG: tetratricopeptide repeat-containing sensor histidine kinase [Cyclobacteriaceae bacterium]|nr:tetratricopeptide repeat-containing sensor histidine kinase [Cyclobacteriaceae bacterium]
MNFNTFVFILLLVSLTAKQAYGQKQRDIDSLKRELEKPHQHDTTQVQVLLAISMNYQSFQTDSSIAYAQASLEKAAAIHSVKGQADALLQIGRLKRDQNNDADALSTMFTALELYRKISDHVQIANALNDISIIYATSGDYEKSLEYFKQALEIFQQTGDEKGESYALNNIGLIYQELKDEEMAKRYFLQSLKIKEKRQDLYGISRGYTNLGSIAENNGKWEESLYYYFKADSLYEKTNDIKAQATNFIAIARVINSQGKLKESKQYSMLALEKAKEVKSLSSMLAAYKQLSTVEETQGNYKSSLAYQKRYNEIADSLNNENHRANLDELKAKFNFEEQERKIAFLKKEQELQEAVVERKNIVTYALAGGMILLMVIIGLLFYAYRTTRSKRDILAQKNIEIETRNDELDKLNKEKDRFFSILSHDLKGPLSSLKGLSYLLTMSKDALTPDELLQLRSKIDTSLDNLTALINNILEWSMATSQKREWSFVKIDTLELIQKNISLYQNIAESKGVNLVYEQQEACYAYADYHAVDTVIRNLLSNSIKYSHANKDVVIGTRKAEEKVFISVKDEGVGMAEEIQNDLFTLKVNASRPGTNNEKGTGLGLMLCMELMKENKGSIQVKSKAGEGSEFIISIPECV